MANAKITINLDAKQAVKSTDDLEKSIGGIAEQSKSAKQELREMKEALLELEPGTAEFEKMSQEAAVLQDRIGDVNARVKVLSSDTLALDQGVGVITGMAGAFQAAQGAAALLGVENEELLKVIKNLQATQAVINGLTQVSNMLNKDSAAGILLRNTYTKVLNFLTVKQTVATGTATVATRALGVAMKALPILAIVGGITALISIFSSLGDEVEEVSVKIENLNNKKLDGIRNEIDQFKRGAGTLADVFDELDRKVAAGELSQTDAIKERRSIIEDELNKLPKETFEKLQQIKQLEEAEANISKLKGNLTDDEFKLFQKSYQDRKKLVQEYGIDVLEFNAMNDADQKELVETILEREKGLFDQRNKLTKELRKIDDDAAGERKKNSEKRLDNERKRLELLFMAENQEKINQLERLKRQEELLIKEGATDDQILQQKQEVNNKEKEIATEKFEFLIKQAKGNADKIKLLELQRIGELEKIESNYQNNVEKFNNESEKRQEDRINKNLKAIEDANVAKAKLNQLTLMKEELATAQSEEEKKKIRERYDNELIDARISQIETERDILLKNTKLTEEERRKIILQSDLQIAEIREQTSEESETSFQGMMEKIAEQFTLFSNAVMDIFGSINDFMNMKAENASIERQQQLDAETESLQHQLNERMISEEEFQSKKENLERQAAARDLIERRKQFKREKAYNIAMAIVNTAQAILQALGSMPPPASFIMAGLKAAAGAVQIATISGQQFKAARGGIVPGNQRKTVDSVPALLAPGEAVINSRSAAMFPNLLSDINQMGGGVPLNALPTEKSGAKKDIEPTYNDNKPMNVRVSVGVDEITKTQDRLTRYNELNEF